MAEELPTKEQVSGSNPKPRITKAHRLDRVYARAIAQDDGKRDITVNNFGGIENNQFMIKIKAKTMFSRETPLSYLLKRRS